MTLRHCAVPSAFALSFALASSAGANLLVNGSFEDPVLAAGGATIFATGATLPAVAGAWHVIGDPGTSIYLLQTTYNEPFNQVAGFNAEDGLNSVDLTGPANVGPTAGVQQTVAVAPGYPYQLSFYVGRVTPHSGPAIPYVSAATVDVRINGGARIPFTSSGVVNDAIRWQLCTYSFIPAASPVTIAFLNGTMGGSSGSNEAGLDNVSLDGPNPLAAPPVTPALGLAAPRPNPSAGEVEFDYSLARASRVRLTLVDVAGRCVRTLADEIETAGPHFCAIGSADPLPGGLYFVRLEAEGRVLTRRLALLR